MDPTQSDDASAGAGGARRGLVGSFLAAAGLIAAVTVVARLVGFGRIFVFTWAVGYNAVGDIYQAVNTIPNIVFEIVAGGALASVVVPLLAAAVDRGDRTTVDRSASALLTWTLAILTPLAVLVALAAGPIVEALRPDTASPADLALGRMLLVLFAPQLVLYGVGIVLTGVLQAHRRFAWPAVAPLLSSVTVIACYLLYAAVGGAADPAALSTTAAVVLAVGTTLGVAVLSLCLLVPLRATAVRLRPTFGFPPGGSAQARRLVGSGVVAVLGQQIALVVVLKLASDGRDGSLVAYTVAQTLFLLPWAVLAVPVATSAFPRLAAAFDTGDLPTYRATLRTATHTVLTVSAWAAAVLVGTSVPVAVVVTSVGQAGGEATDAVGQAMALFAPGLLGYGLLALLARALYAAGATWSAAVVTLGGWSVVVVADLTLATVLPVADRVPALAAGHSIGVTGLGVALTVLTVRTVGRDALRGTVRTVLAVVAAGVPAGAAGWLAVARLPGEGVLVALGHGLVAATVVTAVFGALAWMVGAPGVRPVVRAMLRRTRRQKEQV